MKSLATLLLAALCALPVFAADTAPADKERLDLLIQQNRELIAQNAALLARRDRPRTREEAFAFCMQAAGGEKSAMAAESVGSHCAQILQGAHAK